MTRFCIENQSFSVAETGDARERGGDTLARDPGWVHGLRQVYAGVVSERCRLTSMNCSRACNMPRGALRKLKLIEFVENMRK